MEETVLFKMDVSDESIKREAMKVVWKIPGVTLVDLEEKGILKVKGIFDKTRMGHKLQKIDESVDFINPSQKSYLGTISNYVFTPKLQEIIVFEFEVLNELIKLEVMKVIWEFSGITSVEVGKDCNIKVKGGEFNKLEMVTKVKQINETVKTILDGGEPENKNTSSKDGFSMGKVVGIGVAAVDKAKEITNNVVGAVNKHQEAQKKQQEQQKLAPGRKAFNDGNQGPQRNKVQGYIKNALDWYNKPPENKQQQQQRNLGVKPNKEDIDKWQRLMAAGANGPNHKAKAHVAAGANGPNHKAKAHVAAGANGPDHKAKPHVVAKDKGPAKNPKNPASVAEGSTSDGTTTLNYMGDTITGLSRTLLSNFTGGASGSYWDSKQTLKPEDTKVAAEQANKRKPKNNNTKKP